MLVDLIRISNDEIAVVANTNKVCIDVGTYKPIDEFNDSVVEMNDPCVFLRETHRNSANRKNVYIWQDYITAEVFISYD